jgi:histidinol-phosphate aminotransferase
MKKIINRRSLLKSGIISLTTLAALPEIKLQAGSPLSGGPFADFPLTLDADRHIFRSPRLREVIPEEDAKASPLTVRLNANENPYGPPASVRLAVSESIAAGGNRYPGAEVHQLIGRIADKEGVGRGNIMMGPGSSDLLERVAMVLFSDGQGNIISADPTFMSIINVVKAVGADWKAIPCSTDWSHDLDAMEAAIDSQTRLIYICNPHNPVGSVTNSKKLADFCRRVAGKVPVFIDEAYIELASNTDTESMVSLVKENENVIICRTFSKVMGMAGLRVGYLVAQTEFIGHMQKIARSEGGISCTSAVAASASLSDHAFQQMTCTKNQQTKEYLCSHLQRLKYSFIPSFTNFVLFPVQISGKELLAQMAAKGVGIRAFEIDGKPWCRVSLGTAEEMAVFVNVLEQMG